jgi:TMEM175 potassium channel family protein
MSKGLTAKGHSETARLEAFSDGVLAIAITLLVLYLKVPPPGTVSMWRALWQAWPDYLSFLISFVVIGIYWANHHYMFNLIARTNHWLNLLNLFFLLCIVFLPFPTDVMAAYIRRPGDQLSAVLFYVGTLLACAISYNLTWRYAAYWGDLIDERLDPEFIRSMTRKYDLGLLSYIASFVVAFWSLKVSLLIDLAIAVMFFFPSPKPKYLAAHEEHHRDRAEWA